MAAFLDNFERGITAVSGVFWGPPMIILLVGTGLFLTVTLRFLQIRKFKHSLEVISGRYDDPKDAGDLSHFQALSAALSATIGIGNIAGVALAIHYGGPGALFWMWVTAFVGMTTKYTECFLAHRFRVIHKDGSASGGPMYFIERGLGRNFKWLGVLFALCAAIASLGSANMVQGNTIAQVWQQDFHIPSWASGLVFATLVGMVIIGGIRRIGQVASRLVPAMCVIYMIAGITVLLLNLGALPGAIALIVQRAFQPTAAAGGFLGSTLLLTVQWGVRRGLFSNEAGQGSAAIAHAAAKTTESVREGIVAMIGPFIDTIVVCSVTGLVIVATGSWTDAVGPDGVLLNGAALTAEAFRVGLSPILPMGNYLVSIAVPLFAFSTVIAWSYYGDRSVSYLFGPGAILPYRLVYVVAHFLGFVLTLEIVWNLGDVANGMMAAPNLIALWGLAALVRRETADYFAREPEWRRARKADARS